MEVLVRKLDIGIYFGLKSLFLFPIFIKKGEDDLSEEGEDWEELERKAAKSDRLKRTRGGGEEEEESYGGGRKRKQQRRSSRR